METAAPKPANPFDANTNHALRGDYDAARDDYTIDQPYDRYTPEDHARWRFLYQRQEALLPG